MNTQRVVHLCGVRESERHIIWINGLITINVSYKHIYMRPRVCLQYLVMYRPDAQLVKQSRMTLIPCCYLYVEDSLLKDNNIWVIRVKIGDIVVFHELQYEGLSVNIYDGLSNDIECLIKCLQSRYFIVTVFASIKDSIYSYKMVLEYSSKIIQEFIISIDSNRTEQLSTSVETTQIKYSFKCRNSNFPSVQRIGGRFFHGFTNNECNRGGIIFYTVLSPSHDIQQHGPFCDLLELYRILEYPIIFGSNYNTIILYKLFQRFDIEIELNFLCKPCQGLLNPCLILNTNLYLIIRSSNFEGQFLERYLLVLRVFVNKCLVIQIFKTSSIRIGCVIQVLNANDVINRRYISEYDFINTGCRDADIFFTNTTFTRKKHKQIIEFRGTVQYFVIRIYRCLATTAFRSILMVGKEEKSCSAIAYAHAIGLHVFHSYGTLFMNKHLENVVYGFNAFLSRLQSNNKKTLISFYLYEITCTDDMLIYVRISHIMFRNSILRYALSVTEELKMLHTGINLWVVHISKYTPNKSN